MPDRRLLPPVPARDESVARQAERLLREHVVAPWFPRCVDRSGGGFLCDFDRFWRPHGRQDRMLEFQARQTRTAARLAQAFPGDGRFAEVSAHGVRFLREVMWDRGYGGFYWKVDRHGQPLAAGTKHAHSICYAAHACGLAYQVTGDDEALQLAAETLDWFFRRAHDGPGDGYCNWFRADGTPIAGAGDIPPGAGTSDPISHAIGIHDINVHGDWFETLSDLLPVHPSLALDAELRHLATLILQHFTTPYGETHFAIHPGGSVIPQPERFGYGFQSVSRMLSAPPISGMTAALHARAEMLIRRLVSAAAHPSGEGFCFAAAADAPRELEGTPLVVPRRSWWVQWEAAKALGHAASRMWPDEPGYARRLRKQFAFIEQDLVDPHYRGTYPVCLSDIPWRRRPFGRLGHARELDKGNEWKDASHDADALLTLMRLDL